MQDVAVRNNKEKLNVVVHSHEIDHTKIPPPYGLGLEINEVCINTDEKRCPLESKVLVETLQHPL